MLETHMVFVKDVNGRIIAQKGVKPEEKARVVAFNLCEEYREKPEARLVEIVELHPGNPKTVKAWEKPYDSWIRIV